MKYICPLLTVEDMERSKKFYQEIMGQKISEDYGENIVFDGSFSLHLKEHYRSLLGGREVRNGENNIELYFEESDLEHMQEKLKSGNVSFIHEITTQPWMQRVLRVYDPDGYIVEIGESLKDVCIRLNRDGKSVPEIMSLTALPETFVEDALGG